jgi:glycosyltransferase involved in cell wall biosynthesis
MEPFVSVLMTCYNREQFIAEAIESVLASTYTKFQLIIVDDASTDNTVEIANAYARKDNRISLYINSKNLGDYPNRNRAASYATGKYLKYVDSDDLLFPESISVMVKMMEECPEAGLGICDFCAKKPEAYPLVLTAREAYSFHYHRRPIFFASPGQVIFCNEAFHAVGGFPEKRMVGDFEMWHKMALHFPLLLLPSNLYWVRQHVGQEVMLQNKYILDYERIKVNYLLGKNTPFSRKEAFTIFRKRQYTVLKIFIRKLSAFQFAEAAVRFRVFLFYWCFKWQLRFASQSVHKD